MTLQNLSPTSIVLGLSLATVTVICIAVASSIVPKLLDLKKKTEERRATLPRSEEWIKQWKSLAIGRVFVVTGATQGLGWETTKVLRKAGAIVVMGVRDVKRGETLKNQFEKEISSLSDFEKGKLIVLPYEATSFDKVRSFAQRVKQEAGHVDVLICNAGVPPNGINTQDGFELAHQVNHFSHALLFMLLEPMMHKRGNLRPRVVLVSSAAHFVAAPIAWPDIDKNKKGFESDAPVQLHRRFAVYGTTKLMNILMARHIASSFPNMDAFAVHPGMVNSAIWSWFVPGFIKQAIMLDAEHAASTQVYAALAPEPGPSGSYIIPGPLITKPEVRSDFDLDAVTQRLWKETICCLKNFLS